MISVARRRDVSAVMIGAVLALVGWVGAFSQAIPLLALREPGLEIALLLQATYSPSFRATRVPEWVVFVANVAFWSAATVLSRGVRRAFQRAHNARAWLVCAALIAAPLVLLSEMLSDLFGGVLSALWWVTYPGWALNTLVPWLPQMPFMTDTRALVVELMYPTRLIHFIVADLLATAAWTVLIWVAILGWRGFRSHQHRPQVRVA